jgi:DNA-directed RNA polymerase II subunit RPB2
MTLGQLLESLTGIWCAKRGTHTDGTIFNDHNIESVTAELERMGFTNAGYQKLYGGFTGEYVNTLIFMGPTYYQRLQKFTSDTVYAISKGRTDELTRQPLVGKARHGSLRLGEMEVWVLLSHGAMRFLSEKMYAHSDGYYIYICSTCGRRAIVNHERDIYICKHCKGDAAIVEIPSAWASSLAMNEISSMNIGMKFQTQPYRMEINEDDYKGVANQLRSVIQDD